MLINEILDESGATKCWDGYRRAGRKRKPDGTYKNVCVKEDDEVSENKRQYLDFDKLYGRAFKITDAEGDPSRPGFSIVTPLNGNAWTDWKERPQFKKIVRQRLNDPGFLGDHKYQQIVDAMTGRSFDASRHTATNENFADGKVKGKSRPGRVKKAGASCKGSVTSLRAKARKYGGERGKMYHWCANMKGGKK